MNKSLILRLAHLFPERPLLSGAMLGALIGLLRVAF